ncbi:ABC transporter ATP-binding protein [Chengkuizengella axinellae]|uniref:ABC transporter ATP-binding protein n=1 Tax=Chengkuizengella axinellae TaxID=3064388 RepID=A0ABT9J097_9BACL|nr:ABC transporter ATP-binding protein [Chengkuizengella sp. 2205SS18-9]MDP5274903.1 ABC transporter ATP-binding protein [Chengkuizengella sp. 2205SS18-9]
MELLNVSINQANYNDKPNVIEDILFSINEGELVGLIGPNGAGKSTTIKCILGLIKSYEGEVQFVGPDKNYSYIPEHPIYYENWTLWEHLELASAAYDIPQGKFVTKAKQLIQQFQMKEVIHHYPSSFSKGMQQKMMLIIGLLNSPDVYIVDEPFIGLDPIATQTFLEYLEKERNRGAGILMSTHVLDTAEKICDRFICMNQGKMVAKGNLQELRNQSDMSAEASLFELFLKNTKVEDN